MVIRGVFQRLPLFAVCLLGVIYGKPVFAEADFLGTPETRSKNVPGNFHPCDNNEVREFIGKDRAEVLKQLKTLNLRTIRVLDGMAPVNFEFVPDRLTLVLSERGKVTRAFCR